MGSCGPNQVCLFRRGGLHLRYSPDSYDLRAPFVRHSWKAKIIMAALAPAFGALAPAFGACGYTGERCPHAGKNSKANGMRWFACCICHWESPQEKTAKYMHQDGVCSQTGIRYKSGDYICLLCWLATKRDRLRFGDVCLCKDTMMMLAHMRLRQLCLAHWENRAAPGIQGLDDIWNDIWNDICLALRARCAELEARVEALESQEMHAAADNFDLAALEELMSTDWMMQGGGSGSGDGLPNLSRVAACPTLRLRGSSNRRLELSRPFALLARPSVDPARNCHPITIAIASVR